MTVARLGPIPGFEWDVDLSANITARGVGPVEGKPIGDGEVAVNWQPAPRWQKRRQGSFAIRARTGQIVGTMEAQHSTTIGSVTILSGTARVTDGSNVYRGLRSIPGAPLRMLYVIGRDGRATLRLQGRMVAASVDGTLVLTPLDPLAPPKCGFGYRCP